jgi:hypothetical protein
MMDRRLRVAVLLAVVVSAAWPAAARADQSREHEPASGRKSGTYLKLGLAHWQGNIFSEGKLTQWTVDLFGAKYDLTSVNVEIERYFGGTLLVSGFSLGYRKDAVQHIDSGHMFSAGLFRDLDFKVAALKAGGGMEWGLPSLNFDQTEFDYAGDGTVRYRHTHPGRNAYVPFVGTRSDGALYPYLQLSVVQRPGGVLLEGGMRVNVIRFHFDDYEVDPLDEMRHASSERRVLVPYLFVNVGFRLF